MADLNQFIGNMRWLCNNANIGYDQLDRWNFNIEAGECDCSSLVIYALQQAGFDTGNASYTGDMSDNLCARGWIRVANDGNPQPGDILLNDVNHTAVWLGDCLAQASQDENGNATGGEAGDQTGYETFTTNYYDYPWDCYLRWTGQIEPIPTPWFGGQYVCIVDCVNVRNAPTTNATIVAQYVMGQTVFLDDNFIEAEGIIWGTYISYGGERRYLAVNNNGQNYFQKC